MKWSREKQRSRSGYPDLRTMEEPKRSPENAVARHSKHPEAAEGQDDSQCLSRRDCPQTLGTKARDMTVNSMRQGLISIYCLPITSEACT